VRFDITLTTEFSYPVADSQSGGFRVKITASNPVGLADAAIFAYLAQPVIPGEAERVGMFDHPCTPTDLEEYPIDAPNDDAIPPWFRSHVVDLVFRSRAECLETQNDIYGRVELLLEALAKQECLVDTETITLSATSDCAPAGSSSSSYGA
jgi:hypothetical protein